MGNGSSDDHGRPALTPAHSASEYRNEILVFVATLLLMLWPLAINGAPFYSADSASYLHGGAFGFSTGLLIIGQWWHSLFETASAAVATDPKAVVATAIAKSGGARSVIYSLTAYVLRIPGSSLLALAVAQAGVVVLVLTWLRRIIAASTDVRSSFAFGTAIAVLTTAPWYAAYAMPDIFAGIAIAGSLALTVFFDRISLAVRLGLAFLTAFCITAHSSHLLIAFSTLLAGGAANLWLKRVSMADALGKAFWFASPLVVAVIALLATSYAAFGEASLAPKRYPIQLARSVADGPGAWYLRDHCATEKYAICEVFGSNPPRKVNDFLWGHNGVRYRATPAQMERIRAEESMIVRRAAMEYPSNQIGRSVRNSFAQFFEFGLKGLVFGETMLAGEDPTISTASDDRPGLRSAGEVVIYASFFGSVLMLLHFRRRLKREEVAAISVAFIGLVANATVCGTLSGVTDRYQGRVAWVIPALASLIALRIWNERQPVRTTAV